MEADGQTYTEDPLGDAMLKEYSKHCRNLPLPRLGVCTPYKCCIFTELGWYRDLTRPFIGRVFLLEKYSDKVLEIMKPVHPKEKEKFEKFSISSWCLAE